MLATTSVARSKLDTRTSSITRISRTPRTSRKPSSLPPEKLELMAHKKKMNAAALAAYREENINFLANLEGKPGIQTLRCGVKYRVITPAPPAPEDATERTLRKLQSTPQPRSVVTVHYEGKLIDGKQFDSSRRGSGAPAVFRVNELITGWQVALVNMHIGEKWEIYVPAEAGYGERGAGRDIPGHSTLIFQLELIDIN